MEKAYPALVDKLVLHDQVFNSL